MNNTPPYKMTSKIYRPKQSAPVASPDIAEPVVAEEPRVKDLYCLTGRSVDEIARLLPDDETRKRFLIALDAKAEEKKEERLVDKIVNIDNVKNVATRIFTGALGGLIF